MPVCNGLLCAMALGPRDCAVNGRCSSCSDIFGLLVFGLAGEDGEGGHVLTRRRISAKSSSVLEFGQLALSARSGALR